MTRISRHREKYGTGNELSRDNSEEGTAARTRPCSYEDIMLRRKNKKLVIDAEDRAGELGKFSGKNNVESVADHSESDGGYKLTLDAKKDDSEDKKASKKKGGDTSRSKVKETHDIDANSKVKSDKHSTSRAKSDNSRSHHRSRNDEQSRDDSENELEKMHLKETLRKDQYADMDREKSERVAKRNHQKGNHQGSRSEITGNDGKKRDSGKWHDSEYSEKRARKASSQSRHKEVRPKRRSSRSWEHDRDTKRRSPSVTPRAHKRTSYHGQDHGDTTFRSSRDRSARQYSDVDRYRTSSNGGHSSSHYRRHGGSGLGGYSPRKRRSEAAIKTPSPTPRSPERKNLGWDLRPVGMDNVSSSSVLTKFQPPDTTTSSNSQDLPTTSPVISNVTKLLFEASQSAITMIKNHSVDSVQLTQATRPLRSLYLENVPASASEKDLMDYLNDFLSPMSVNHVKVTKPCISCIINKEKGQAVVEFLTAEDATSALSFDGRSFSGSILRIRRPKDFVEPATGATEIPAAAADAIPDIINDSPHKIFVGGISRAVSSNMFMEIASAFGHLKAFRFQLDKDLNEPVVFLEYVDQSVTLKACAGLSGMKLGGQVLTAVQAFPCASREESGEHPFYGIPERAKPLLEKPTKVLKLKNVFKPEDLSSLSGLELEETLEDIRLECARFGTVKSINIVRNNSTSEKVEVSVEADAEGASQYPEGDDGTNKTELIEEDTAINSSTHIMVEPPVNDELLQEIGNAGNNNTSEEKPALDVVENESSEPTQPDGDNMALVEAPSQMDTDGNSQETPNRLDLLKHEAENKGSDVQALESGPANDLMVEEGLGPQEAASDKLQESSIVLNDDVAMESGDLEEGDAKLTASPLDEVFEHGSVLVEYLREEASCVAAHCLHGRLYGDQVVEVGYISHDLYLARFPK